MDFALSVGNVIKGIPMLPYQKLPKVQRSEGLTLLEGLRILDMTTSIAGPYATQLLGDLGATVLKIEKTGAGDDARQWGPPFLAGESPWYLSVNRNKHSMTLNVSTPEGLSILERLLETADVLVLNIVSRTQAKLGLDYASLHSKFPKLIHASLTGFGLEGPRSNLPCYDLIAEGYSGIMDLTGEADSDPQKVGTPAADMLAGQDVAMAILAAVVARQRTGKGSQIDVSMQASMTRFVSPRLLSYLSSDELPTRSGGKDSVIAIYQTFDTADEKIALGLGNDEIWKRFWTAVQDPEFGANPDYATNSGRRRHRADIVEKIARILRLEPRDSWLALFAQNRIPAGPINRLDDVAADPDLLAKQFLYTIDAQGGPVPQIGLGITFNGSQQVHRKPPPSLGEDTSLVLEEWLGMKAEQINKLRQSGVI